MMVVLVERVAKEDEDEEEVSLSVTVYVGESW